MGLRVFPGGGKSARDDAIQLEKELLEVVYRHADVMPLPTALGVLWLVMQEIRQASLDAE